ncbi:MAG: ABC transporter substrate-binding protein [Candidatus Eremiobacteraeota bacterium]|nr:ABC transporter substrate-binding protein [Candidatus Eremiobacteraeota bacterium]
MKEKSAASVITDVVFKVVIVMIFLMGILQLNNIEKDLIEISGRLQQLDESNKELTSAVKKLQESGIPQNGSRQGGGGPEAVGPDVKRGGRKYLHPEVKNFLGDETFKIRLPESQVGGRLKRWYGADPKSFNYIVSNDGELSSQIGNYVYNEGFGTRSRDNPDKWVKALAERVEITDDYKEYTIYLKKGVKWHAPVVDWSNPKYGWLKGDHYLTTKDVKFTVDMILNNQVECSHLRNYYEDLDYVKIIDDHTVIFKWKKKTYNAMIFTIGLFPMPEFLYAYDEDGKPFPKEIRGLKFNSHWYNTKGPIGCGPYKFVSYEQGASIRLKRFDDYYDQKPAIDEIDWLIYPDQKQNLLKLKSRAQDYGRLYPTDYREEILNAKPDSLFKNGSIKHDIFDEMGFLYLGWNNESVFFSDRKVRWAMSHALNRSYMLQNIFMGLGTLITGPLYVNGPANDKSIPQVAFSLEKSKALLAQAGWKDLDNDGIVEKKIGNAMKKFDFSFLLNQGSPEWTAAMNIYKEDLLKIGVKMNLKIVDWAEMQKKMEDKDFDAMAGAWGMPWEQDPYQIWHSSQATLPKSSNHISFKNKEADQVIEELRSTFDVSKRTALYHKFHRIVYDEQPYTFFFARKRVAAWWNYVERVIFMKLKPHEDSMPWYINEKAEK